MNTKYSDFLEINPSFESVVDIDADKRNENLWREYIVGKDMCDLMEHLCQSLGNEAPDSRRSFWINGSYGTGKSYAAIFVKHLLEEKPELVEKFLSKNSRLSAYKNRFMKCRKGGDYLVIWKDGCSGVRTGDMLLIEMEQAIREALLERFGDDADLCSGSLYDVIKEKLNDPAINWDFMLSTTTLGDSYNSVEELCSMVEEGDLTAIQDTAAVLHQKNITLIKNLETFKKWVTAVINANNLEKSGIFFIWDEFTEYVSNSDEHIILQQISEFTKVTPLFALFIVHKSTDLVARIGGAEKYEQISHRFHEVEFHLTADAALDLIAGSINIKNGMAEHWKDARKSVIHNIHPKLADLTIGPDDKMAEYINNFCPMHPMTIRLLSRVAENYAAAERTMFRFMKDRSNEDIGFAGYIHRYGPYDQACWLTPDWLWDYFFTRDSDFLDKDTKVAEYIRHYEDSKNLVESDENALRLFKIAMLLMAVMSSTKGLFSGSRVNGGISATVQCLKLCLAGVMSEEQTDDLLETIQECKLIVLDTAANGVVRLQMPFSTDGGSFQLRYSENDKKYTRYQMFAKDGAFSQEYEKFTRQVWGENSANIRRMKICVCCAETISVKNRLDEIQKDLEKFPYKLGLLVVIVKDNNQFMAVQQDLQQRATDLGEDRLLIALVRNPLKEEIRKKWLNAITKLGMAKDSGQSVTIYETESNTVINTWVHPTVYGGSMIVWNGTQVFKNIYGLPQLKKTIEIEVLDRLFPYAPENIVITGTAYKSCPESAPLAGIQRKTNTSQLKNVLAGLGPLLNITDINEMSEVSGNKASESVSALARTVRDEMQSGQKIVLADLWTKLMQPPFGYYDTIACGVLMGYVFTSYKNSEYTWNDSQQAPHVLVEKNLKTMVLNMVKGKMTTDYLSSGSEIFRLFRDYVKSIMSLTDVQVANETECWHNMREAVTQSGAPFWALKYLPEKVWGNLSNQQIAKEIVDQMQEFIVQDHNREKIMGNVNQLFTGSGKKIRPILAKAFQNKSVMSDAFRAFLFESSPELHEIVDNLRIKSEELSDKLHMVMQDAIYTWTEEQVLDKIPDVISEYRYLDALNDAMGKVYHSVEDAGKDLANLFKFVRIPLSIIEKLDKPWYGALKAMYKVSNNQNVHMTDDERSEDSSELRAFGKAAMDFLKDGKIVLSDLLEAVNLECTDKELADIYSGLGGMTVTTSTQQFEKELSRMKNQISQARNCILLQERWSSVTGCETIKEWCQSHKAPIFWIVPKEQKKVFETILNVQKKQHVFDSDVVSAISVFDSMDTSILNDNQKIEDALLKVIGEEYAQVFHSERHVILSKAKMKLGNDMSSWDVSDLSILQRNLRNMQKEKAKKEKLSNTKKHVQTMSEKTLRSMVQSFLDAHPEFCDEFND